MRQVVLQHMLKVIIGKLEVAPAAAATAHTRYAHTAVMRQVCDKVCWSIGCIMWCTMWMLEQGILEHGMLEHRLKHVVYRMALHVRYTHEHEQRTRCTWLGMVETEATCVSR